MSEPIVGLDGKPLQPLMPIPARFRPQKDITAYELAQLLPYYLGLALLFQADWDKLGETVTRHLERMDQPKVTT